MADRDRARTAGFSHDITKPADPADLAALIANGTGSEYATARKRHQYLAATFGESV